jgi:DNA polymerase-3 subunit epsilon
MKIALFWDTETTGLPLWKEPSESPEQPHIVQLSAELVDLETREVVDSMDVIVRPDGWTIPEEMTAIHGITNETALEAGIPEKDAIARLLELRARSVLRVAHNKTFDDRIVRIGLKRFFDDLQSEDPQPSDAWKEGESFCTCYGSKSACALPGKKLPTLEEAHRILVGLELEGAHNAMNDTRGCKAVYFALKDREQAAVAA